MITPKIDPEYYRIVHRHSKEDSDQIEQSLLRYGFWKNHPIIINNDDVILDGHERWTLCQKHGIEPIFERMAFISKFDERRFVIECNLARRNLTTFQRIELNQELFKIAQEEAKERERHGASGSIEKGKTSEIVAKKLMISPRTYERALVVINKGDEDLKEKVRSGKVTINYAASYLQRKDVRDSPPIPFPEGQWGLVEMDFPWDHQIKLEGATKYKTMTVEEGKKEYPTLPGAANSVLLMWVVNSKKMEAAELIDFWGYRQTSAIAWVKTRQGKIDPDEIIDESKIQFGNGFYARGAHEEVWICTKGKPTAPFESDRPISVVFAERTEHSRKPEIFYEIFEKMFPRLNKLRCFARDERPGWTSHGDQIVVEA